MLNRFPYNPAHLMVATGRHVGRFAALRDVRARGAARLLALAERALEVEYRPHGLNVGASLGRVAGAGFPGHLHLPRGATLERDAITCRWWRRHGCCRDAGRHLKRLRRALRRIEEDPAKRWGAAR